MTINEFLDTCQGVDLLEILAAGNHRDTGRLNDVKRYDLDAWLRQAGCFVPESRDTAQLLCRHLVEIEWIRRQPGYAGGEDNQKALRLWEKFKHAARFWQSSDRGFVTVTDEVTGVVQQVKKPKASGGEATYSLPAKLTKEHPCHPKSTFKARGQSVLVRDLFLPPGTSLTAREATDRLVADGFKCNQDPLRAIYFVLNEWRKKGWLLV